MANVLKLLVLVSLLALYAFDQTIAHDGDAKPVVLQRDEGELRTRCLRQGFSAPASEFLLKIGPKTSGSKHLLLFTEEVSPGAIIPKHKHHSEEEILLIGTGNAHAWLGDKEYNAQPGAQVFIPAETWVSLKSTGNEKIRLVAAWNEPGFEKMLRCGSVPKGEAASGLTGPTYL